MKTTSFDWCQQSGDVSPTLSKCQVEGIFGQTGPVILGGLHWLQVGGILLYVMSHLLMSTIWDVIPYQYLSHDSWPLGFLTPHLVPINIYLCSLVIFVRVLTTKVTESCSFRIWFMWNFLDDLMLKLLLSWVILMQLVPHMCLWLGYLGSLTLFPFPNW
jgi:hypothetical protein